MKSVLISIQPKWVEKIARGEKTIEVRKTRPKIDTPFKCYIYCTNNGGTLHKAYDGLHYHKSYVGKNDRSNITGKVIGEFICHEIDEFYVYPNGAVQYWNCHNLEESCLTYNELSNYVGKGEYGYAWSIYHLKIYDKPKELSEFSKYGFDRFVPIKRPFQSWGYVESLGE
jgi:predicted transcriptional regulator